MISFNVMAVSIILFGQYNKPSFFVSGDSHILTVVLVVDLANRLKDICQCYESHGIVLNWWLSKLMSVFLAVIIIIWDLYWDFPLLHHSFSYWRFHFETKLIPIKFLLYLKGQKIPTRAIAIALAKSAVDWLSKLKMANPLRLAGPSKSNRHRKWRPTGE